MLVLNNPQRLAKLLASLNVPGSDRPLSPVEVANEIELMCNDLSGDLKGVINRLPVSADIVKEFLALMKLPPEIQDVVTWGESNKANGSIGFSAAAKISKLKNHDDVLRLAGTILNMSRPVTKEEIKGVISLKKRVPDKPIDECIAEVLNVTRQTTIHNFLFICKINFNIELLAKNNPKSSFHDAVFSILKGKFPPETLKSVKISGDHVRLVLEKKGWEFIATYAEQHSLYRQNVVTHMLESGGVINDA